MANCEEEEHIFAAAQHILKALWANKHLGDDAKRTIAELECHLSAVFPTIERDEAVHAEVEERLKSAERKVMQWKANPSSIWDSGPTKPCEYLQAVNEIQSVMEILGGLSMNNISKRRELTRRAQCALQIAMSRLEEELYHIIVQHKQSFEPQYMSFRSHMVDAASNESFASVEDEIVDKASSDVTATELVQHTIDLVDPQVIPDIKAIACAMFASNYEKEFRETFIGIRKQALDEYLSSLKFEKVSIEDLMKLDWENLNSQIKIWLRAVEIFVRLYLASEKRFCGQILGEFDSVSSFCFAEISEASILCLLNFGEAVAMGPHRPEKLFRLLDMYEVVLDILPDIDELYSEETGFFIRLELHGLSMSLRDSAMVTLTEFEDLILSDASIQCFPQGGIHHLTRYVMNYISTLTVYSGILDCILKDQPVDGQSASPEIDSGQNSNDVSSSVLSPLAHRLRSLISALESNLTEKSKLYKDGSLGYIFLVNNIHYMVQKVKDSELRLLFGDEWIRKHNGKFMKHAMSYERATWSSIISILKDDGKANAKEKCKRFCNAFEEVYKSQTQWHIPNPQLREDLQISTSQNLVHAYRTFLGNSRDIGDKYIKYTPDDLGKMILDLFVGSPRSLNNSRRG
ncbi:hypothetical protein K2173_007027 [Erythroxylum novogranatense]|uniref:Exocyst subunit Exo70 family protein n=1 Tax=Erythroxylum novogranatense TaxID=1862640 RepID=A0AAV8SKD7_9ROSI|nr:hypothetical protein K2173_007027 [Erythroxylum novogranatense]